MVSTIADMARVAAGLLDGMAPGSDALRSLGTPTGRPGRELGMFWVVEPDCSGNSKTMVWQNGQTGGYLPSLHAIPRPAALWSCWPTLLVPASSAVLR